jgi:RNA polymerase sigma-70 factor (ECF subfamily)
MLSEIEACIPALRRYALALLREQRDADHLVHDCLVLALDKLHTRRHGGDVRAWLFAILHNLFVSQRRRKRRRSVTDDVTERVEALSGPPPEADSVLRGHELMKAFNKLPDDQRAIMVLIAIEDFSYAEAAQVLGVPIATVMSRLSRAREKLRNVAEQPTSACLRRVK